MRTDVSGGLLQGTRSAYLLSEMVTVMESMSSTVETLDWSKVRASVVSLSSARPMIEIGWTEVLTCAETETTGFEVDTEMFTVAFDCGDVLMFSASAGAAHDNRC